MVEFNSNYFYIISRERMSKYTKTFFMRCDSRHSIDDVVNLLNKFDIQYEGICQDICWNKKENKRIVSHIGTHLTPYMIASPNRYTWDNRQTWNNNSVVIKFNNNNYYINPTAHSLSENEWKTLLGIWKDLEEEKGSASKTVKDKINRITGLAANIGTEDFYNSLIVSDIIA